MPKIWLPLLVVFLVTLPLLYPYLKSGYPQTDDGFWAVVRQSEMHREIKNLQIPPRWSTYLNHGYGYPLFNFTYPFPYYVGEVIHLTGVGVINAVKLLFIAGTLLASIAMFFFVKSFWGSTAGILAALLYSYAPYKITNLYSRGSLGEVLAAGFFPLLFLFYKKLIEKPTFAKMLVCCVTLSMLILTHNASTILFVPFLGLWVGYLLLVNPKKSIHTLRSVAISFGLALSLTCFFWLPALLEKKFIALSVVPLTNQMDHFMRVDELFGQVLHKTTGLPLHLGNLHLALAVLGLVLVLFLRQRQKKQPTTHLDAILFASGMIVSIFLLFPASQFIWHLPLLKEIDFPWRMLGIAVFFMSVLGGAVASTRIGILVIATAGVLTFMQYGTEIKNVPHHFNPDSYYETNDGTTTSNDELMPVWVEDKPKARTPLSHPTVTITKYEEISQSLRFDTISPTNTQFTLNTLYFPGWKVYIDGTEAHISPSEQQGLIQFLLPSGTHSVRADFTNTFVRTLANYMSIAGFLSVLYLWYLSRKSHHLFS